MVYFSFEKYKTTWMKNDVANIDCSCNKDNKLFDF